MGNGRYTSEGISAPASTTLELHGRYVTFRFVDGTEETYVVSDLVHALAAIAGATCVVRKPSL